jgi:hypothetical protein
MGFQGKQMHNLKPYYSKGAEEVGQEEINSMPFK